MFMILYRSNKVENNPQLKIFVLWISNSITLQYWSYKWFCMWNDEVSHVKGYFKPRADVQYDLSDSVSVQNGRYSTTSRLACMTFLMMDKPWMGEDLTGEKGNDPYDYHFRIRYYLLSSQYQLCSII